FYRLSSYLADQDKTIRLVLYCDKGIMSRLHVAHLQDQGFTNVAVYRPSAG
ncbi:MAG: tRNA 4-thiouridine(8) synthase ThiI, partial [Pseudohongiellaceae bacterium]